MAQYHANLSKEQVQAILKDCKGARATAIIWKDAEAVGFYSYHEIKAPSGTLDERRILDLKTLGYQRDLDGKSLTLDSSESTTFACILKSYHAGVVVELWPDSYEGKCNITIGEHNGYKIATLTFRGPNSFSESYCAIEKVITSFDYDRIS